jgi:hypothetical protein
MIGYWILFGGSWRDLRCFGGFVGWMDGREISGGCGYG